jgi:hypothetical protein
VDDLVLGQNMFGKRYSNQCEDAFNRQAMLTTMPLAMVTACILDHEVQRVNARANQCSQLSCEWYEHQQ